MVLEFVSLVKPELARLMVLLVYDPNLLTLQYARHELGQNWTLSLVLRE